MKKKRSRYLICIVAILLFSFAACQQGTISSTDSGQGMVESTDTEGDEMSSETENSGESSVDGDSVMDDELSEGNSTSQGSQENEKEESEGGWADIEFPRP